MSTHTLHDFSKESHLERPTLIVAAVTSFMGPFMISAVNVALPVIQAEFKISAVVLSWISTAYLLATAVFLVPAGKIADIHGRKRIFTTGLILFVVASCFLALTNSIVMLITLRILQGLGGAMIVTIGMAIVTSVFPPDRRGRAIGIYVAAVYVGLSAGPTVGGMLTHHLGWRSIFLAMIPFGVLSIIITFSRLKTEWRGDRDEKLDWFGSIFFLYPWGACVAWIWFCAFFFPEHECDHGRGASAVFRHCFGRRGHHAGDRSDDEHGDCNDCFCGHHGGFAPVGIKSPQIFNKRKNRFLDFYNLMCHWIIFLINPG